MTPHLGCHILYVAGQESASSLIRFRLFGLATASRSPRQLASRDIAPAFDSNSNQNKTTHTGESVLFVPPAGIEPTYAASKAAVLSVERQGQNRATLSQKKQKIKYTG